MKKSKPYSLYYHHNLKRTPAEARVPSTLSAEGGEVGSAMMISILICCLFEGSTDLGGP